MSRSDNTPWKREYDPYWKWWGLPRGEGRILRRHWNKGQRARARNALARQEEPGPARPRGSVRYDYW